MPTVDIAVVAHPDRKIMAQKLADKVGAGSIAWDTGGVGPYGNHLQAWKYLLTADTEWVCVLEDDAVPVDNFGYQLDQVLAHVPGDLVGLYLGRGRPDQWQLPISSAICQDVCFLRANTLLHAVGYVVYTPILKKLYSSVNRCSRKIELSEAIGRWARSTDRGVFHTRPSIVDHLDGPSVIRDEDREDGQSRKVAPNASGTALRKAWMFGGRGIWNSTWADIPSPDMRTLSKISLRPLSLSAPTRR